jgi:hypothetical protein
LEATPVPERVGGELGTVVTANVLGCTATSGDESIEDGEGCVRVDPSATLDDQRLAVNSSTTCKSLRIRPSTV